MIDADALAARLPEYLPQQRWFGAKDRVIARVVAVDQEPIDDGSPALLWAAATVEFEGGGADVYQLVLDASRDSEIVDATADPDLALRL